MKRVRVGLLLLSAALNLKAEEPLSLEIKQMQEIEPGFVPKDKRSVELFIEQQKAKAHEEALKDTQAKSAAIKEQISRKFREDLAKFAAQRTDAIEEKMNASIDEAIKYYEHALANNPDHDLVADALYHLGQYYFEQDEKDYFAKLAIYSEARDQGRDDVAYPEENFTRTIDTYEKLIKEFPDYAHMDSVYYLYSLALWYEGVFYNAVENFKILLNKFPNSRYTEEVNFRLGEYYYDMGDFNDAVASYEKVVKNPQSPLYDKALYKMAWSYFQKDRFRLAIENFVKVLELSYKDGENPALSMKNEVTRYIVKSFGDELYLEDGRKPKVSKVPSKKDATDNKNAKPQIDKYDELMGEKLANRIISYFAASKPYTSDIFIEAASQLLEESKIDGAIKMFQALVSLDLNSQDNPRYQSQIVDILQEANRLDEARAQNNYLIERYGKNSEWYQAQVKANNLVAVRYAKEAVRDAMLALAVHYHKMGKELKAAQKTAEADDNFKKAAMLYLAYVKEYPERDDTHKALFYFAEAAYELSRFRSALDAYGLVKEYPLPMADNFRRDATFNIVFTFRHVLESEAKEGRFKEIDFDALTAKSRGATPEEIPEIGQKYLQAIADFLKISPNDEQVPVLLFHAATIYYVYGHSDEALARFFYIIDSHPQSDAANVAARLILDDSISKEDWPRVVELSKLFKEKLKAQESDFSRFEGNARFKLARAVFDQASELKKNNQLAQSKVKFKEAADLFSSILAEDPKNPYADVMLFNSARAIVESGTMTEALPIYKRIYTEYPNSDYAKSARFQEALALEKMLKFSEAAKAYDAIIKQDPTSESAGDAMLNVALLYEAADDLKKASTSYLEFAKKYPDRQEAPEALLSAAALYKRMGNTAQQIAMLEQFIKQYKKDQPRTTNIIEAHVQIADTYLDLEKNAKTPAAKEQNRKLALASYRSAVGLFRQDLEPLASFYAAKAQLVLEKSEQDGFRTMKITGRTGKEQSDQMTAMLKKLTDLTAKNEAIIKAYAQPVWNAESLRRIGDLYMHLAKTMLKAPCPRDVASIDDFACDEYLVLLEDKAAILEEKALNAYKQAYEIAITAYDAPPELVNNILAGLKTLKPNDYQQVGNLLESPETGSVLGLGKMLSDGKMASTLHPAELGEKVLEDKKPAKEPEVKPEDIAPVKKPQDEFLEEDFQ